MIRPVLTVPHPALRETCAAVESFGAGLETLVADMFASLYAAKGRGLAAPQIGVTKRVFVMDATWKTGAKSPRVFINPEIITASAETALAEEQCLSLPETPILVRRPCKVTLRFQDIAGAVHEEAFDRFEALCVQHERDHLDGILITDKGAA